MAVYEPNPDWLREQLVSLNRQTCADLELYVRDDASPTFPLQTLREMLGETITNFPFHCMQNAKNEGFNQTFSLLTAQAKGDAFAYCDQDDIWVPEKLSVLAGALRRENVQLAYCNEAVIDADSRIVAADIHTVIPHIVPRSGEGLAPFFFIHNCVPGCVMLVRAAVARQALPFARETIYDQWLALHAAQLGKIVYVSDSLVRHRLHGFNQTETLKGIETKADYISRYLHRDELRVAELGLRLEPSEALARLQTWMATRLAWSRRERGAWKRLFSLRDIKRGVTYFELALPFMPSFVFTAACRRLRRRNLQVK